MQTLSKYQIHSTLHEGVETIVYRGQIPGSPETTILKLLKAEYLLSKQLPASSTNIKFAKISTIPTSLTS
jgi:hypothetical protein